MENWGGGGINWEMRRAQTRENKRSKSTTSIYRDSSDNYNNSPSAVLVVACSLHIVAAQHTIWIQLVGEGVG